MFTRVGSTIRDGQGSGPWSLGSSHLRQCLLNLHHVFYLSVKTRQLILYAHLSELGQCCGKACLSLRYECLSLHFRLNFHLFLWFLYLLKTCSVLLVLFEYVLHLHELLLSSFILLEIQILTRLDLFFLLVLFQTHLAILTLLIISGIL